MNEFFRQYKKCTLCPRMCGVNRESGEKGFCNEKGVPVIGRASLHHWEEPCISGKNGSGTVFFSGCTLRCCYCQNYKLSRGGTGEEADEKRLCDIFLSLEKKGAHNINLVTAEHFAPHIKEAVSLARKRGMGIPVILNSSGYVKEETIELLKDSVDVFLVDFKYMDESSGKKYSMAKNYSEIAKKALFKMVSLTGSPVFDDEGMIKKGVIVRHLCLPGHKEDSKKVIEYVFKTYGDKVILSIMNQYTPVVKDVPFENLRRGLSQKEYDEILDFCIRLGIEDAYIQEGGTDEESFIPEFGKENIIL